MPDNPRPWGRCNECGHDTRNGPLCSFCEPKEYPVPNIKTTDIPNSDQPEQSRVD